VVTDIVRAMAAERGATGDEHEHVEYLLNGGRSTGLKIIGHHPEWHDPATDESIGGLVTALVARRRHRRGATVCVYLLDVYCLGIKNAMGPDHDGRAGAPSTHDHAFGGYEAPPMPAPIEFVRELVLGAADYARQLGFAPHPDSAPSGAPSAPKASTTQSASTSTSYDSRADDHRHPGTGSDLNSYTAGTTPILTKATSI